MLIIKPMKQKSVFKFFLVIVFLVCVVFIGLRIASYYNDRDGKNSSINLDFPDELLVGDNNYLLRDISELEDDGNARWSIYELEGTPSSSGLNLLKWSNESGDKEFPELDSTLNDPRAYIVDTLKAGVDLETTVMSAEFNKLDNKTQSYELRYSYKAVTTDNSNVYWYFVIDYDYKNDLVHEFSVSSEQPSDGFFNELDEAKEALENSGNYIR